MNVEFERKNVQDVYTVRVQGRAVATVRLDRAMSKVYEAAITARDGLVGIRTEEYHVAMDASENETDHLVMVALSDAMFHVGCYILANEGAPPSLAGMALVRAEHRKNLVDDMVPYSAFVAAQERGLR